MVYQICDGLVKYAATIILQDINFEIRNTEKIAVVGRNGCGKSTLLKVIAGMISLDDGFINRAGKPSIGYLEQTSFEDVSISVEEELVKAFGPLIEFQEKMNCLTEQMKLLVEPINHLVEPINHLEEPINYLAEPMKNLVEPLNHLAEHRNHFAEPMKDLVEPRMTISSEQLLKEFSRVQEQFENYGGYTYKAEMDTVFTQFGFDIEGLKRPLSEFSGGQQTKISFIKLLLSKPDILLLDEPTNHLDLTTIEWLERYLKTYNKAVIVVSHDRMFLDQIADITYEIEYLGMTRYVGNYTSFIEQKKINFEKQKKDFAAQQKEIESLNALIERFKNKPTKVAMTRSKLKYIEHMETVEKPRRSDLKKFKAGFVPRIKGGEVVMTIDSLIIGYDKPLCEVSINITNGQRIAVIGGNGMGKSTFVKTLIGQLEALGGNYEYGHEIEVGYFDQQLAQFTNDKTVFDDFCDEYPKMTQTEVRSILGCFLFSSDNVFKKVNILSGGEKVRLCLAKLLQKKPNFLILDEPTNHLDIVGKETLEELLRDYTGTVLLISHDRYFIKQIADTIVVMEDGKITYYRYGYEEYVEKTAEKKMNMSSVTKGKSVKDTSSKDISSKDISSKDTSNKNVSSKDTFHTDKYYNPKKEADKKEQKVTNLEKRIDEQEQIIKQIKEEMYHPELVIEYEKLIELDEKLQQNEAQLDDLMEQWDCFMKA